MLPGLSDFDYPLEEELIAQQPTEPRDSSRLMVLDRRTGYSDHRIFRELPELLRAGDVLVFNDTRVIPAKFVCRRSTGGRIEGLFLREVRPGQWEVLLRGARRCREGEALSLVGSEATELRLLENAGQGRWLVEVSPPAGAVDILESVGSPPLPPYIHRPGPLPDAEDRRRYQTVYADRPGAVAAPTAGLHFTPRVLDALDDAGVQTVRVTLHVGLGTFEPVGSEDLSAHDMHSEWYELSAEAAEKLTAAREQHRRIIAVGTTSVRVLETVAQQHGELKAASGWTDLFLYPPAEFHVTDAMLTNFHLPRSTLLMLVAAFCSPGSIEGIRTILDAYAEARRRKYRFYSYGDAMLIL
ncbi:MAG: tRNA preQ1(34) S-adenosylmethionine ribosyltransferase-isomerase QueA [Phycisphaerae bacterium]